MKFVTFKGEIVKSKCCGALVTRQVLDFIDGSLVAGRPFPLHEYFCSKCKKNITPEIVMQFPPKRPARAFPARSWRAEN